MLASNIAELIGPKTYKLTIIPSTTYVEDDATGEKYRQTSYQAEIVRNMPRGIVYTSAVYDDAYTAADELVRFMTNEEYQYRRKEW